MKAFFISTAILIIALPLAAFAQEAETDSPPADLVSLLESYREKRTNGLLRLNQHYLERLTELQKKYVMAGNLEAAVAVREEVVRLSAETEKLTESLPQTSTTGATLDWNPRTEDELKKLLQAQPWDWFEEGNDQKTAFLNDSRFKIEGKSGKFGWEVTGSKDVTLRLGANQKQSLFFRFSPSKRELQPREGVAAARKITLKPAAK